MHQQLQVWGQERPGTNAETASVHGGADRTQAGASLPVSRLQRSLLKVLQFLHERRRGCVSAHGDVCLR